MEVVLYVVCRDGAGYECLRMYRGLGLRVGDLRKEGGRKSRKTYLVADAADIAARQLAV